MGDVKHLFSGEITKIIFTEFKLNFKKCITKTRFIHFKVLARFYNIVLNLGFLN